MNNRLIIPLLLCAGALAFACGPRSRSEPTPLSTTAARALTAKNPQRSAAKPNTKIKSDLEVAVGEREVHFALNVQNIGNKHVELSFPSGQSYEIVVVDSVGREVWQWSEGRMFTQGIQNKQLGTGDAMRVAEVWKQPVSGHYTAIATLNSSNYPVTERAEFIIP